MQRKSKNLVLFLIIPMVVACSAAVGFGGMITSTVNPIIPETITEEVIPEAPVEETVVAEPDIIEIAAPDPVVVEEVPIAEPEPEVVEEWVWRVDDPATIDLVGDNFVVGFPPGDPRRMQYTITYTIENRQTDDSWYMVDSGSDILLSDEDVLAGETLLPVPAPGGVFDFGWVDYRVTVTVTNGETHVGVTEPPIPVYIPAPADILVMTIDNGNYLPVTILISNEGELPLFIDNIEIGSANNEVDQWIDAADPAWEVPATILPTSVGIHTVSIYSNDPDPAENPARVLYEILEVPVATFAVADADMAAGIGSERFGVTIEHDTLGVDYTVTAWIEDANTLELASPVETVVINSDGVDATEIDLKILFVDAGTDYQYRVVIDGELDETITGVSLNHWSEFNRLRNAGSNWEAQVKWDPVTVDVGDLSVFVALRKWDGEKLWDVEDSEGNQVVVSEDLDAAALAEGEATLLLAKPDSKNLGTEVVGGETWMEGYGAGYYFFTYMAPTSATNPWAERIGCPPEGL
jgi:hypothetical protein